ncbi:hypothetical protein EVAR_40029_1 [Eumeta japonica]|uniref:Tesmin/TSO1-like CXC domain-containing protein n=1 Tax=Eumeta variegata TaxID=151549 RepID=A0A4C1YSR7_EUMVA|nr:hypothetical protein EVAR_40029_1 [Eumeta japonica]
MLPIFHAAGHFNYMKGAQIYLQDMQKLGNSMDPDEYLKFTEEGLFTIRRTNKPWSGMPYAFDILDQLEQIAHCSSASSDQHVELTSTRQKKDKEDIAVFKCWLDDHGVFENRPDKLMSLSTGLVGDKTIDCHRALEKGLESMAKMLNVFQAPEDADALIVQTAIDIAYSVNKRVIVVGTDVDLAMLIIALTPEGKPVDMLKPKILKQPERKGKRSLLQLLETDVTTHEYVEVFYNSNSSREEIKKAGETLLPPTSELHINIPTYFFTSSVWLGKIFNPENYGRKKTETTFLPVQTEDPLAPAELLTMVHCSCVTSNCSKNCGCKKAGLRCTRACKHCRGETCLNSTDIVVRNTNEDDNDNEILKDNELEEETIM